MDENLKKEIIMEHYQTPIHRYNPNDDSYIKINTKNASCIDDIDLYIKLKDNVIEDIAFSGEACAISISSTSIMISNLIGKTKEEAMEIIRNFENMIDEKEYDHDLLKEANAYDEIYKQGNRKSCAYLPYKDLKKVLEENND